MSYDIVQLKKTPSELKVFCTDETEVDNIMEWANKKSEFISHSAIIKTTKYRVNIHHVDCLDELIVALLNMGWEPMNFSYDGTVYNFKRTIIVGPPPNIQYY